LTLGATGSSFHIMRWRLATAGLRLVCGLTLVFAAGCAKISPFSTRHAPTEAEPSTMKKDDAQVSSRSDRLRGDLTYKPAEPTEAPRPASMQEPLPQSLRPQSLQPAEIASPPRSAEEPDPRAVIDWLLQERR